MTILALFALALGAAAPADIREPIRQSEAALYAADFETGTRHLDAALGTARLAPDARLELLVQKLRFQQNARLAGVTVGDEKAVIGEIETLMKTSGNRSLKGLATLRLTISTYFTALIADQTAKSLDFVPTFLSAAEAIEAPCQRSEALFFAALMPQVAGEVAASKVGLEAARKATADGCALEQSYIDRHFAWVAEDAGDLTAARDFAVRSSATRRQIGFEIFQPFSLLLEADLEARTGNAARADALVHEAVDMARRLKLTAASTEACAVIKSRALVSDKCAPISL
ncbi:hypothetical protein ACVWZA_001225 [Sphingomonas sp. UYAg733]